MKIHIYLWRVCGTKYGMVCLKILLTELFLQLNIFITSDVLSFNVFSSSLSMGSNTKYSFQQSAPFWGGPVFPGIYPGRRGAAGLRGLAPWQPSIRAHACSHQTVEQLGSLRLLGLFCRGWGRESNPSFIGCQVCSSKQDNTNYFFQVSCIIEHSTYTNTVPSNLPTGTERPWDALVTAWFYNIFIVCVKAGRQILALTVSQESAKVPSFWGAVGMLHCPWLFGEHNMSSPNLLCFGIRIILCWLF